MGIKFQLTRECIQQSVDLLLKSPQHGSHAPSILWGTTIILGLDSLAPSRWKMKAWKRHSSFLKHWSENDTCVIHSHFSGEYHMATCGFKQWLENVVFGWGSHFSVKSLWTPSPPTPNVIFFRAGSIILLCIPHYTNSTGLVQKRCSLNIPWVNEYMNDGMVAIFFCVFQKINLGLLFN